MIDMSSVIIAKSDQINAADLIGKTMTVKIAGVKLTGAEQATEIRLVGEDKVWRPNKNTVRIMSRAWGNDGEKWIGRSATLYCDPKVRFGKDTPGGIRISHLSGLRDTLTVCLQERKGVLKTYEIEPLPEAAAAPVTDPADKAQAWLDGYLDAVEACTDMDELIATQTKHAKALGKLATQFPMLHAQAVTAGTGRAAALAPADEFEAMEPAE